MISLPEILFKRGEVSKILGVTVATLANREKAGKFPEAKRDVNNYRMYSLQDVMSLQLASYGYINTVPLAEALFDKGYSSPKEVAQMIEAAIQERTLH